MALMLKVTVCLFGGSVDCVDKFLLLSSERLDHFDYAANPL